MDFKLGFGCGFKYRPNQFTPYIQQFLSQTRKQLQIANVGAMICLGISLAQTPEMNESFLVQTQDINAGFEEL